MTWPLSVRIPDGPTYKYPLRGWVMRNYVRYGVSRPTLVGAPIYTQGLPDTCKLAKSDLVSLRKPLQEFWFSLLVDAAPPSWTLDQVKNAWRSLTHGGRCFTNGHGHNNGYQDYINGINPGRPPMLFEPIITTGVLDILGDPVNVPGAGLCWPVKVINGEKDPTEEVREYLFEAVNSRREGYNLLTGKWAREDLSQPFPQLGGAPVPVPLFSRDYGEGPRYGLDLSSPFTVNYIAVDRVQLLGPNDPVPPTYVL